MAYTYKNILNLQGSGEAVREVILVIQHPDFGPGSIDFNHITPMPLWASRGNETSREAWCKEHWGVTANALGLEESVETYDGGDTIEFNTLAGDVRELMRKLSMMFPADGLRPADGLTVDYLWASSDVGKDGGMVQFQRGEQTYEYIPEPGSPAAYELAFDIFATSAADHGLVFDNDLGTYRYSGQSLSGGQSLREREDDDAEE